MSAVATTNGPAQAPLLCLRRDLRSSLHECRGERFFLVEDPAREAFFRLGLVEWELASKLDGQTPLGDAYQEVCNELGHSAVSPEKAHSVCQWLSRNGLLKTDVSASAPTATPRQPVGPMMLVSAFFFRVPLLRPDRWLAWMLPYARWAFTWPAFVGWFVLVVCGVQSVWQHWGRFCESTSIYASPHIWVYLGVVWIALKVVHELFHALACKHFGGRVGASGIAFILFAPIAFVDVTSAWTFRSKWHRIWTSAAGMYVEFACAAIAAIIWAASDSPLIQSVCHSVVMAASVTTVLFNGNPLMRFDGYYILTDFVEIQNLYGVAREHVRGSLAKLFFGVPAKSQLPAGWPGIFIRTYGWAAATWRILVCLSLMLAAATLFHGAGIVLAAAAGVAWFAKPVVELVRYLMTLHEQNKSTVARFAAISSGLVAMAVLVSLLPFPGGVSAPAIVDFEPLHYVRSEAAGFVQGLRVTTGQNVAEGATLMTIRNDELETELRQARAELQQAMIRARVLHREHDLAGYQAAQQHIVALAEHRDSLKAQVVGLTVKAPAAGRILTRQLSELVGQYIDVGMPLVTIGDESSKAVLASIPEEYVESFEERVNTTAGVWIRGGQRSVEEAMLVRVEPSATDTLRHAALGSHAGGPIPVRVLASEAGEASTAQFRMVAPRFHGVVQLTPEESRALRAGQLADVRFTDWSESIGKKVYRRVTAWIRMKLGRTG